MGRDKRPDSVEGSSGILRLPDEASLFWGEDTGVLAADVFCKDSKQR